MNKYAQKLALFLIDRRIKKAKKQKNKTPLTRDGGYHKLVQQRWNIASINNFWQGSFSPTPWTRWAKPKYVEKCQIFVGISTPLRTSSLMDLTMMLGAMLLLNSGLHPMNQRQITGPQNID